MDLYIDKENIDSFIKNHNHELYNDCIKTMQKQLNVFFNFKKEEIVKNDVLMAWFNNFTSGVGVKNIQVFNNEKFPQRPLKSNIYIDFNKHQLSSIYLINDEKIANIKEKGAILIGEPGEEFDVFNQLFFSQKDYKFEKKLQIGGDKFTKWNDLVTYSFCLSDILFVDSYILFDHKMVEVNFIPFLKSIVSKSRCKINIVLLVNNDKININYKDISLIIRSSIESVTGIKPNFTLIKVRDKRSVSSYAEHDRTVFTNYARVYSGDSFNYFNQDGIKITKGREIHFSSFGDCENHELALELVNDIQRKIDDLPEEVVEGDKKSNFIKFK